MSNITIYGISTCDTIKKTLDWFKANKLEVSFHNYKKQGIETEKLTDWSKVVGWQLLLNKKGTTWRTLSPAAQLAIVDETTAIEFMRQNTSSIKRPVIEFGKKVLVGFDEEILKKLFT